MPGERIIEGANLQFVRAVRTGFAVTAGFVLNHSAGVVLEWADPSRNSYSGTALVAGIVTGLAMAADQLRADRAETEWRFAE